MKTSKSSEKVIRAEEGGGATPAGKCPCGAWICKKCLSCSSDCGCAEPDVPCDCWFKDKQVCDVCQGCPAHQPVPCPVCSAPIFVRGNGTVVSHYDGKGDRCEANERQFLGQLKDVIPEPVVVPKCAYCDKEGHWKCENCDAPICEDHESGEYDDVETCKDAEACSQRIEDAPCIKGCTCVIGNKIVETEMRLCPVHGIVAPKPTSSAKQDESYFFETGSDGYWSAIVPFSELKKTVHNSMCMCGLAWEKCGSAGVPETCALIDDKSEWEFKDGDYRWKWGQDFEDGFISITRLMVDPMASPSTPVSGGQEFEDWFAENGPCESNVTLRGHSWMWTLLRNYCEQAWNASRAAVPVAEAVGGQEFSEETMLNYLSGIESLACTRYSHTGESKYLSEALDARIAINSWRGKKLGAVSVGGEDAPKLYSALERLRHNAQHIFDKKAVRDWAETLAEADAALDAHEAIRKAGK